MADTATEPTMLSEHSPAALVDTHAPADSSNTREVEAEVPAAGSEGTAAGGAQDAEEEVKELPVEQEAQQELGE
ncbi:hypothetical protein NBRC10512_004542, partial [Rhodotorula toruloides]